MDIDRYSANGSKTWTGSPLGVENHPCGEPRFEPFFAGLASSFEHAQLVRHISCGVSVTQLDRALIGAPK